jgi:hypothetical protein
MVAAERRQDIERTSPPTPKPPSRTTQDSYTRRTRKPVYSCLRSAPVLITPCANSDTPIIVSSPVSIILSPIVYPSRGRSTSRYSLQQPHVFQSSATFQPSPATTASTTVRARINAVRRKQESRSEAMSLHAEQSRLLVGWPLRQWRTMLCSRGAEASDRWCTWRSAVS